jgi:hypothetical protein
MACPPEEADDAFHVALKQLLQQGIGSIGLATIRGAAYSSMDAENHPALSSGWDTKVL